MAIRENFSDGSIDGTVLKVKDAPYFVWSCHRGQARSGPDEQSLCIAPLETPTKIDMSKVGVISQPRAEWEVQGRAINEGPAPLYWDNEI
jgi:GH43 family beta-xylosidase